MEIVKEHNLFEKEIIKKIFTVMFDQFHLLLLN